MSLKLTERKYLPEFVYGGIDGVVTTFAVVSGSIGASFNSTIILILGFANLIADGFSMSIASYLATKSQSDLHIHHSDYAKIKRKGKNPFKIGLATFISFILVGFIPLLSFVLAHIFPSLNENKFVYSFILTGMALFMIGAVKGFVVRKSPFLAALETLVIGAVASLLAFLVGYVLKGIIS